MLGWSIIGDQTTTNIRCKYMNKQVYKVAKNQLKLSHSWNYKFIFSLRCKSLATHIVEHSEVHKTLETWMKQGSKR